MVSSVISALKQSQADASRIVEDIGDIGTTGKFQKIANSETYQANLWRWITIGLFALGMSGAIATFIKFWGEAFSSENAWSALIRLVYAIPVNEDGVLMSWIYRYEGGVKIAVAGYAGLDLNYSRITIQVDDSAHGINECWELSAAQTKGKHPRTVFVSQRLQAELANYLATRHIKNADIPFFHTDHRLRFSPNGLATHSFLFLHLTHNFCRLYQIQKFSD
jgi:hypothetical protein